MYNKKCSAVVITPKPGGLWKHTYHCNNKFPISPCCLYGPEGKKAPICCDENKCEETYPLTGEPER